MPAKPKDTRTPAELRSRIRKLEKIIKDAVALSCDREIELHGGGGAHDRSPEWRFIRQLDRILARRVIRQSTSNSPAHE